MKTKWFYRILFYTVGLILLACGLTFNAKVSLGVSCMMSVPYALSQIFSVSYAWMIFLVYSVFVILQLILRRRQKDYKILLQLPFSFVFSLLMDGCDRLFSFEQLSLAARLCILAAAILLTAVGAAMMVYTKLIPSPVDGLAAAVGEALHKDMGFGKNLCDCVAVVISCLIGLICAGKIVGIGVGTLASMVLIGRCISLFNRLCKQKIEALCLPEKA